MLPVILMLKLVSIGRLVSYPHPSNQRDFPSCWCWCVQAVAGNTLLTITTPHPPAPAAAVAPFCGGTDSIDTHFSDAINIKIGDRRAIYFPLHNVLLRTTHAYLQNTL